MHYFNAYEIITSITSWYCLRMTNFVVHGVCGSIERPRKHEGERKCANKRICITNEMFKKWRHLKAELQLANELP